MPGIFGYYGKESKKKLSQEMKSLLSHGEICSNDECLFFQVDDPEDLSQKINFLMQNRELQSKRVKNAYNKVKSHKYSKRSEIILKKLCDYQKKKKSKGFLRWF